MSTRLGRVLATLLSASFLVPLASSLPVHAAGNAFLLWPNNRSFTSFGPNNSVDIDTGAISLKCPERNVFSPSADIYIVPSGQVPAVGQPLHDVSGHPHTVIANPDGSFLSETIGFTGPAGKIGSGRYAVVYNECQNGILDSADIDTVFDPAFEVSIPTTVPPIDPAFVAELQAFKADAKELSEHWEHAHDNAENTFRAITALEIALGLLDLVEEHNPFELILFPARHAIGEASEHMALGGIDNLAKHYKQLSLDPPDPNFQQLTPLSPRTLVDAQSADPVSAAVAGLGNAAINEDALADALRASIERYQGAAAQGNGRWALVHARAIRHYVGLLAAQVPATNAALAALRSALSADTRNLDKSAANLETLRQRVLASGFTPAELDAAQRLGLSGTQIGQLRTDFTAHAFTFTKAGFLANLDSLITANGTVVTHLGALAGKIDAIITSLKADPSVPDQTPVASAGGPYAGAAGAPILFTGAATTSPAPITGYAWDLTGTGAFTDATGQSPSFTYTHAFHGLVGVNVTNAAGLASVAYAALTVTDSKRPPTITSFSPTDLMQQILVNTFRTFSVTASQPDGDAVAIEWFLDGHSVATGSSFTFQTAASVGSHTLEVVVTGAGPLGKSVRMSWTAGVATPGPPRIVATLSPAANADGWNNSDVTVSWSLSDDVGVASSSGCGPSTVATETSGTLLTCSATNTAGVHASKSVTVKLDKTPPSISGSRAPAANTAGWNNTDVTVTFTCADSLSGLASCPSPTKVTGEGAGQSVTGTATDHAGNTGTATVSGINIDKTAPTTTATPTPAPNADGFNSSDVTVSLSATDNPGGSGIKELHYILSGAQGGSAVVPGDHTSVKVSTEGITTVTYFAIDNAGNQESEKTLIVALAKTTPVIRALVNPPPNANGWNNTNVTVTWAVAAPGGIKTSSGCGSTTLTSESLTGAGTTLICTATNMAGLSNSGSVTVRIDKTPPSITGSVFPASTSGWSTFAEVSFICTDALSGVAACTAPIFLGTEGANQSASGTAVDRAGNQTTVTVTGINIDQTPPTTTAVATPAANANGWNNGNVTVNFSATDKGGSGVKEIHVSVNGQNQVLAGATGSVTVSAAVVTTLAYAALDAAGNLESNHFLTLYIDKTPPTTTATPFPLPNPNGFIHSAATVTLHAIDSGGSGVQEIHYSLRGAQVDDKVVQGDVTFVQIAAEGYTTITFFALDRAGNEEAAGTFVVKIDTNLPKVEAGFAVTAFATQFRGDHAFGSTFAGPLGLAFDASSNLYVMDIADGHIYKFGPAGGVASAATRVDTTPIDGLPVGLTFDKAGHLYAARLKQPQTQTGDVLELNPSTGAVIRTVASLSNCDAIGIATDPLSGDLFVTTAGFGATCGSVLRISNFENGHAGTVTLYAKTGATDGITFGPDGTIYVEADNAAKKVTGTNAANPGTVTKIVDVAALDGLAIAASADPSQPPFLYGNGNFGTISKIDLTTTPPTVTSFVTEGSRGDLVAVGPDGCLYATQTTTVLRVTNADGSCALAPSGALPRLGLSPPSSAHTVGGSHTASASLRNVAGLAGVSVTFTVTGANPQTAIRQTDANGTATLTYVGQNPGVDTIAASATVGTGSVGSNLATVTWSKEGGPADLIPPTTIAVVSPAANANGWNKSDFIVSLTAADEPGGSGVKEIAAVASGAQTGVTITPGDRATTTIVQEGTTTLTFFATDTAGNQENPKSITVRIDRAPPVISGSRTPGPGTGGWNRSDVVVTFTCSDTLSGIASCPTLTILTAEGADQSVTGTAVDKAGNTATAIVSHISIDKTAPTTTAVSTRGAHQVTVNLNAADNPGGSGVREIHFELTGAQTDSRVVSGGSASVVVTAKGITTLRYFAIDVAGNHEPVNTLNIPIDTPAPTISASRTPPPNQDGWNNTDVTVTFTCDAVAGVESCSPPVTLKDEGAGQSATGTVTDKADSQASTTVSGVNIDRTAPTISGSRTPAPNAAGWNNTNVTVSFSCADSLSGVAGCLGGTTLTTEGANQSVSGMATDKAGNAAAATVAGINIDKTPPVTTASASPGPNAAGWNKSDVTVHVSAADNPGGSGVKAIHVSLSGAQTDNRVVSGDIASVPVTAEGITTLTYFAADKAGNEESPKTLIIRLEKTAPTISGSRTPAANANGWNNSDVTVTFTCSGSLAGIVACPSSTTLTNEGANQSVTGTVTDEAGNQASATVSAINIDKTAPATAATASPAADQAGQNSTDVAVKLDATDTGGSGAQEIHYVLSGAQSGSAVVVPGATASATISAEGSTTITYFAVDKAGNQETPKSLTIRIHHPVAVLAPTGSANLAVLSGLLGLILVLLGYRLARRRATR